MTVNADVRVGRSELLCLRLCHHQGSVGDRAKFVPSLVV
jgi:hypothetical protein